MNMSTDKKVLRNIKLMAEENKRLKQDSYAHGMNVSEYMRWLIEMERRCAAAKRDGYQEIITQLREYAEWADANIFEVPIMLPEHLRQAASIIERVGAALCGNKDAEA